MPVYTTTAFVWGIPEQVKPIAPAPERRYKLKLRPKTPAVLIEQTPTGVVRWYLKDAGEHWERWHQVGQNIRGLGKAPSV